MCCACPVCFSCIGPWEVVLGAGAGAMLFNGLARCVEPATSPVWSLYTQRESDERAN